jgi:integrase
MRTAKPYWKTSHKCYYLRLEGKDIRLDPDETKAQDEYFKIMASRTSKPQDQDLTSENATVRQLLVAFLEWSAANDKFRTFEYYQGYLTGPRGFAAYVSPQLRISDLRNFHVTGYLQKFHADHQTGSIVPALKRPFNWAVKEGYIQYNPIQGVKRPPTIGRAGDDDVYIAPTQYDALLAAVPSPEFRDYIEFMYETGCRAEEINKLRSEWFKPDQRCCIIPAVEVKGNKSRRQPKKRFIRLNNRAFEIANRNSAKNPSGHLFRNTRGKPWTANAVRGQFDRKWSREAVGRRITATCFRHTFITDALMFGLMPIEVVKLVGHDSLDMIMQVYEHVETVQVNEDWGKRMTPHFNIGTIARPHTRVG